MIMNEILEQAEGQLRKTWCYDSFAVKIPLHRSHGWCKRENLVAESNREKLENNQIDSRARPFLEAV